MNAKKSLSSLTCTHPTSSALMTMSSTALTAQIHIFLKISCLIPSSSGEFLRRMVLEIARMATNIPRAGERIFIERGGLSEQWTWSVAASSSGVGRSMVRIRRAVVGRTRRPQMEKFIPHFVASLILCARTALPAAEVDR